MPLQISRANYPFSPPPPAGIQFLGHDLLYTKFQIPAEDPKNDVPFVIFSGRFHLRDGDGKKITKEVQAVISTWPHFAAALWANEHLTDLREYGARSDVTLVNSVLLFLKSGTAYDKKDNSGEIYDCQSCDGAPAFATGLAEDLTTVRLAFFDDHFYVITTAPHTVVAELQPPKKAARYFLCSAEVGRKIQASTDKIRIKSRKAAPTLMTPGE
jgi:hypothetical protein